MSTRPESLLLSCFACDPTRGSECFVGWNWATEVHAGVPRIVLTRRLHRKVLSAQSVPGLRFAYFDLPGCAGMDHHHPLMKLYYMAWQVAVLPYAIWLALRHRVTTVQHVTYNSMDFPGLLWAIPGTRFLWGSVGGGQVPPPALRRYYGANWRQQRCRALVKRLAWANPLLRLALLRAEHVFAANSDTFRRLERLIPDRGRLHLILETALHHAGSPRERGAGPLRIVWVGRFEPRKAPSLAVEVMAALEAAAPGRFHLTMIGEGELRDATAAAAAGMAGVTVRGPVPFSEMERIYAASDLLLFTSLQDTSGNVVLEALGKGMPVVALDHHGSADMLRDGGGRLVPVAGPAAVVAGFVAAIRALAAPEAYAEASRQGIANIQRNYLWSSKRRQVRALIDRDGTAPVAAGAAESAP